MRILLTIFILAGVLFGCGGGGGGGSTDQADVVIGDVTVEITGRAANGSAYPITSGSVVYKLRDTAAWSNAVLTINSSGDFSFDATEDYLTPNGLNLFDVCVRNQDSSVVYCAVIPVIGNNGTYSVPNAYLNPVTDHAYRIMTGNAGFDATAYENVITAIADDNNMTTDDLITFTGGNNAIETLKTNLSVGLSVIAEPTALQAQLVRTYDPEVATINAAAISVSVFDAGQNALNHPDVTLSQTNNGWYIDDLGNGEYAVKFNRLTNKDPNGSYDSYIGLDISTSNSMASFWLDSSELNANYSCRKDSDTKVIQFQFDEDTDFEGAMWTPSNIVAGFVTATAVEYDVSTEGITSQQLSAMPECNEAFTNGEQRTVSKQVVLRAFY